MKTIKNILSLIHVKPSNWRTSTKKTIRANSHNSRTFVLFVLFAVFSCSKSPTDSRSGTLTGTVLLEGQPVCAGRQDHSGITVALYKLAELDTTILPCPRLCLRQVNR